MNKLAWGKRSGLFYLTAIDEEKQFDKYLLDLWCLDSGSNQNLRFQWLWQSVVKAGLARQARPALAAIEKFFDAVKVQNQKSFVNQIDLTKLMKEVQAIEKLSPVKIEMDQSCLF